MAASKATADAREQVAGTSEIGPATNSEAPLVAQANTGQQTSPQPDTGIKPSKPLPRFKRFFNRLKGKKEPVKSDAKTTGKSQTGQKASAAIPTVVSDSIRAPDADHSARANENTHEKVLKSAVSAVTPNWKTNVIKTLILGTSESGKSTILKNFQLHLEGTYTEDERMSFQQILWSNTVHCIREVIEGMEVLDIPPENCEAEYHICTIYMQPQEIESFNDELTRACISLISDSGFQACFERANEYQLVGSAEYYFANIERIGRADYIPTDEDILMSRLKTTGTVDFEFPVHDFKYHVHDVGGVRSERKKWIHACESVEVILFTIDSSNYDQSLFEDETANRMQEQLVLFDSIANSRWFSKSSIFLVFTKADRFREKLQKQPLEKCFPDYTGGSNFDKARDYLTHRFRSLNLYVDRELPAYFLNDVSTSQFAAMLISIHDHITRARRRKKPA